MRTKIFVFAILPENNSNHDLPSLISALNEKFEEQKVQLHFVRQAELLLFARFDDIAFYIGLMKDKSEVPDWYQMAEDAEISGEGNPVDMKGILMRYKNLQTDLSMPYKKSDYVIAQNIMEELDKLEDVSIFAFQ